MNRRDLLRRLASFGRLMQKSRALQYGELWGAHCAHDTSGSSELRRYMAMDDMNESLIHYNDTLFTSFSYVLPSGVSRGLCWV